MIYGFVRQSDGAVTIDSEFGKGTSVEICLPRYKGDLVDAPDAESSRDHRAEANEIVLVVEDEAVVRLLIVETSTIWAIGRLKQPIARPPCVSCNRRSALTFSSAT
jgi:hypothetical protein